MTKRVVYFGMPVAAVLLLFAWLAWPISTDPDVATCRSPAAQIVPENWERWPSLSGSPLQSALAADPVPIFSFTRGGRDQIGNLRSGTIFVDRRGPLQKLDDVRWDDEGHGRYYSTQLHGLVGIEAVLDLDEQLPDEVAQAVGDHIRNWAYCAAHNPEINSRSWYEGTVIKRQSNLLRALAYKRRWGGLGELSLDELLYLIDANVEFLLDTPNVYLFGNHGVRQDMLLAATALSLPEHPRAEEMLRLAEERLEVTAIELFTDEGIWKEHAPGYVDYALRLISEIQLLHDISRDFNPRQFLSRYDSSMTYLLSSLMPSGQIPYIGSSGASRLFERARDRVDIDRALSAASRSLTVFSGYGHAIIRGNHPDGLYLLFVASQNLPAGKRHADDLSFILYKFGRPWISEGGHQTYELTGMTRYLRSPLAHNTYTLDGDYVGESSQPNLETELVEAYEAGDTVLISGRTERFAKQATFERRIEVEDYSRLTISDVLAGKGLWEGRLQIPGDLEVKLESDTVTATAPDGTQMTISFKTDVPLSFSTCHGQERPICGWAKAGHDFGPATTLIWTFQDSAEVAMSIGWFPGAR